MKGLLSDDPALYIIIPLVGGSKSEQVTVYAWEDTDTFNKQTTVQLLQCPFHLLRHAGADPLQTPSLLQVLVLLPLRV